VADKSGRALHDSPVETLGVSRGGDRETWRLGLEEPEFGNFDQHEVHDDHAEQEEEKLRWQY
jgi:hypothetical protein